MSLLLAVFDTALCDSLSVTCDRLVVFSESVPITTEVVNLNPAHTTFNNISVILWQSILLVEETGVPRENHQPVTSH
jgi:hypothetical protein